MTSNHRARIAALALVTLAGAGAARAGTLHAEVEQAAQRSFPEYFELLRHRNVADVPADIERNARVLEQAFEKRGFRARLLGNAAGRPAVLAELTAGAGLPTLLFYLHYDGQPVIAEEWSQAAPFVPVVKRRDAAGRWREVDPALLHERPLDDELRVFARSAADAKAPIMMFLTAIDLLAELGRTPAFNSRIRGTRARIASQ